MDVRTLTLCCLLAVLLPVSLTDNVKVEYFTTVTLACDNRDLNITTIPGNGGDIQAKYWILPSGEKIDNTSTAKMQKGKLSWTISDWFNYSLTVTNVNDEDFGVYYCVLVMPNYHVEIVQKGLNVDGPDYSKLIERYRHNAMIGGIAAAVLFIVICGACLINHFRYSSKRSKNGKEGGELDGGYYDNAAVDPGTEGGKTNGQHDIETSEKL
ncbi:uncharacterized protein LOC110462693 isoform X2 [Mizuhopecten yessoensis]|uniref:Uncharacterized protein n=2 Tax=Mizuhopecten yessoensis TaxID=6573 RepID=A0A210PXU4_MIZYE|nr:uncharacterized protein LOC110462693 isoform X2 [Mizuhopecten yessoensis]OWF41292.1 hypothetical protein KP79_PYT13129 [Mizuhopecten yessoensis]